ncbi:hypothetical protein C8F04DRAFT_1181514 [Mycena alexandri]|uniref:Uncharacterized protein n=1 Tax=Mycena alexandri TaxID=1745969 RepID=A0AAD6T0L4_9AGAR|nr:hypothetical protein C8F04DRAFT_1194352 [Mycena alexandri]KAJ7022643.1 hypothetical protein C8F04DRAFT_1194363 [Mycena alexandri]KAJ7036235.1 hypothetical protein C8F04DRAFT_1181514 [Mycena alexandri]
MPLQTPRLAQAPSLLHFDAKEAVTQRASKELVIWCISLNCLATIAWHSSVLNDIKPVSARLITVYDSCSYRQPYTPLAPGDSILARYLLSSSHVTTPGAIYLPGVLGEEGHQDETRYILGDLPLGLYIRDAEPEPQPEPESALLDSLLINDDEINILRRLSQGEGIEKEDFKAIGALCKSCKLFFLTRTLSSHRDKCIATASRRSTLRPRLK